MNAPRDQLTEFVLGLLPPPRMTEMSRLVEASPALRAEAEQIIEALGDVASGLSPIAPSLEARERLLGKASALPSAAPATERPGARVRPVAATPAPRWANPPAVSAAPAWPGRALTTMATVAALAAAGGIALLALNWPPGDVLRERAPAIALMFLAQAAGIWAALHPGRSRWAIVSWAAVAAGAAIAFAGHVGAVSDAPGWICTAIQLTGGLAPLAVGLRALRGRPWSWHRAITAGLSLGTAGVIWGEIGCHRSALHVLAHHGGTWAALLIACIVIFRALSAPALPREA